MFESFILGMVQGIAEWLPISSEAMVVLVKNNFFSSGMAFSEVISYAIFLHIGTVLAALVYFHKKIAHILKNIFNYARLKTQERQEIWFIVTTTLVSGVVGILLLKVLERYESFFTHESIVNLIVALLLFVTAAFLFISEKKDNHKKDTVLTQKRAGTVGFFQGLSALPGISRSGSTIAAMGLVGIDKKRALELSFILSIPLVIGANIFLNLDTLSRLDFEHVIALTSSFVFGIITIKILLTLVERIRFSAFVGFFAVVLLVFSLI